MSLPLIIGCIWVVMATIVAMLPMKYQYGPGFVLLIVAPILIGWIGYEHGAIYGFFGLIAFASMFRHPLIYLFRRATGKQPAAPK